MSNRQSGYTLLELLVAMILGLFILAGMIQINLSSKKTYQISSYSSVLQDDLKNANYHLSLAARKSGFRSAPWTSSNNAFPIDLIFTGAGQVVTGTDGATTATTADPDTLTIRYQGSGDGAGTPDGVVSDCIGGMLDSGDLAVVTFDVVQNVLRCTTNNATQGAVQTEELVDNIENMQILYGIDTDGNNYANQYINAATVANWQNVVSIRIALLLKTTHEIYNFSDNNTITLNDVDLPAPSDRFMRMQSVSTISLRNVTP